MRYAMAIIRHEPLLIRSFRAFFIAITAVLITQAGFLEPFQLTTGSMAPLLLGVHRQCNCPKCGFPVVVGAPTNTSPANHYDVKCPNCGQGDLGLDKQPDKPGQRLLVDKSAFEWRTPRRWEVIVFRGPDEKATPFVKRVVGLPGETVQIREGRVLIDGEIATIPSEVLKQTRVFIDDLSIPASRSLEITDYWHYNGRSVNRQEDVTDKVSEEKDGKVFRGLHYQSAGRHGIAAPYRLGPDEYFVLGDNSAASDDSRFWHTPGVKHSALIGRVIYPRLASGD